MTLNIALSDKEVGVDPVAVLFRVSAMVSDHATRLRQGNINREGDLGQGVRGRVVAVDYKTVTLRGASGERRTVPITPKRAAILSQEPSTESTAASRRASPRKAPSSSSAQTPHAGTTTRK